MAIKLQGPNLEATAEVKATVDLASHDLMLMATKFLLKDANLANQNWMLTAT